MSEISSTTTPNINSKEARRRLDELQPVADLAHQYSQVQRGTEMPDGSPETDGDHVVHLGAVAVAYALKYRPDLDPGKIALYALWHDIDEAIVGDTPSLGLSEEDMQHKAELEAEGRAEVEHILEPFPKLIQLLRDIDKLSEPEYAFVKAFDKIVPGFTHISNGGISLGKYGVRNLEDILANTHVADKKMTGYASDHPDMIAMRRAGHRRVAEQVLDEPDDTSSS